MDAETVSRMEAAVPFIIGAEYLDEKWIGSAFDRLHDIFRREIAAYPGTVAMYLAEQSQQLRVPERIFFHLVESSEEAGILCRIPNWWKRRAMMVSMNVSLGDEQTSFLGFDAVLSMTSHLEVDGTPLSREDIELLLKQTEGLAFLKGKWIEVDHSRLEQFLKEMDEPGEGMTFLQVLRGMPTNMLPEDEGSLSPTESG